MTTPTVAGVQATLRQAAVLLRQVGWTQRGLVDERGRIDLRQALRLAADGDPLAERFAVHAVEDVLDFRVDLVVWNDHPDRTLEQVLDLLRRATDEPTPATAHQLTERDGEARDVGTGLAAGDLRPGSQASTTTPTLRPRLFPIFSLLRWPAW